MVDESLLDALPTGETHEVEPGVVVERRCFLRATALLLGAASLPGAARAASLARSGSVSLEEFFEIVNPLARDLVRDTTPAGQDRYLLTVAAHALRLGEVALPPDMRDSGQGKGAGTWIGFHPGGEPLRALHWRMEPGTEVRAHAHTYGNVVTVGLGGRVRVRNYQMEGKRDFRTTGTFRVRQTRLQTLGPRDVNLVNLEHDYVHGFEAGPDGGQGLDLTTRILPKPEHPVPYLELIRPLALRDGLYEARWTD
jgi:hypothetical protein